jgi:hypothetical protein
VRDGLRKPVRALAEGAGPDNLETSYNLDNGFTAPNTGKALDSNVAGESRGGRFRWGSDAPWCPLQLSSDNISLD